MLKLPHLAYGGDYSPEQWPEEVWEEDVRLMRQAGVNLVTVAVFAWSRLEPAPGRYELDWLDRVLDLLHGAGVAVDLATATASPPPWLSHHHPEVLPVLADGTRLWPGGRQHYCPSSTAYRAAARRLVEVLAERYGRHPALALWHVGNEPGNGVPACFCDRSAEDFQAWLRRRHGTLDALNDAWGTDFWSQRYSAWEEVLPPRRAPAFPNPAQQLDFMRFSSDAHMECFELERAVLAERTPDVPVTTNWPALTRSLDCWRWAEREDLVSHNSYPDPFDPSAEVGAAMAGDLSRSLGRGRSWLLMEQTPSRVNWRARNAAKAPGQMRLWSYQAIARGSDGVMFFQWRQSRSGAEKFHSAMVPHGPVESSPTWAEVVALGRELPGLDAARGGRVSAEAAILVDWESWWALELPSRPSADVRLTDQLASYYGPLFRANVTADFARPGDDLSGYRLLLVPNLYLVSDAAAARIADFVAGGGTMVMSFFSGIVDPCDRVRLGGYPAPFIDVLGLRVEDWLPLAPDRPAEVRFTDGSGGEGLIWSELVRAQSAEAVAWFQGGTLDGRPAVLRNRFGAGTAWYLGTRLDPAAMTRLVARVCAEAGVAAAAEVPAGVEAVARSTAAGRVLFLLNHGAAAASVRLPFAGVDLVTGRPLTTEGLSLEPRGVAVVQEAPAGP